MAFDRVGLYNCHKEPELHSDNVEFTPAPYVQLIATHAVTKRQSKLEGRNSSQLVLLCRGHLSTTVASVPKLFKLQSPRHWCNTNLQDVTEGEV